ncbi:MAG: tyrosine-type recombinase/integrase, partial [Candidatus Helarchaeota archaeon]
MGGLIKLLDASNLSITQLESLLRKKKKEMISTKKLRDNQDLINVFLNSLNSENTKKAYNASIRRFLRFVSNKNLQFTTKLDLENYFDHLNNLDIKKRSKRLFFTVIKNFFRFFLHKQDIDSHDTLNLHFIENPVSNITRRWKSDEEETIFEILTNNEIKCVLREFKERNWRDYMMVYILADTSMRVNGMLNIKIENIHVEKRIIRTFDKGKMRKYIFGLQLRDELKKYLLMRRRLNFIHDDNTWLFFTMKATKFSPDPFFSYVFPKIKKVIK